MTSAEDYHVIQTFSADRANQAFSVGILPGRVRRRRDLLNPERSSLPVE
jgi:hypothetical protein